MATYQEIDELLAIDEPTGFRSKVVVASLVAADTIRLEVDDGTAEVRARKRYAQSLFRQAYNQAYIFNADNSAKALQPVFEAIYRAVLITNRGMSKAQILGASDTAIQTAVDAAVTYFAAQFPKPVVV